VDEDAREMMASRIKGKKLIVERVGKPGNGMPIAGGGGGESPPDGGPTQPTADVRVARDVYAIIPKDEAMSKHGSVKGNGGEGQKDGEKCIQLRACENRAHLRKRF